MCWTELGLTVAFTKTTVTFLGISAWNEVKNVTVDQKVDSNFSGMGLSLALACSVASFRDAMSQARWLAQTCACISKYMRMSGDAPLTRRLTTGGPSDICALASAERGW